MKTLFVVLGLLTFGLSSCNKEMANGVKEGVTGTVMWFEGNLMPTIDGGKEKSGKPIVREIVFCKPVKSSQLSKNGRFFSGLDEFIIKKTNSDAKGAFAIKLPAGKYSVFTKEEDGYYANSFDGQGFIQVIEVKANELTKLALKVDYKAVY